MASWKEVPPGRQRKPEKGPHTIIYHFLSGEMTSKYDLNEITALLCGHCEYVM